MTHDDLGAWHSIFVRAAQMGACNKSDGGLIACMVCILLRDATAEEMEARHLRGAFTGGEK